MTLRAIAEADLGQVMEGEVSFRWPITLTDPDGNTNADTLYAIANDVSALIDPDTGQLIADRTVTVAIRIASLTAQGLNVPRGVMDSDSKPWVLKLNDISGVEHTTKVVQGNPDFTLGVVNLVLQAYKEG